MREEREKRNQKRQEAEPVIPRTCGHRPLEAPRPLTVMASAFHGISRLASAPLSENPAYVPMAIPYENS